MGYGSPNRSTAFLVLRRRGGCHLQAAAAAAASHARSLIPRRKEITKIKTGVYRAAGSRVLPLQNFERMSSRHRAEVQDLRCGPACSVAASTRSLRGRWEASVQQPYFRISLATRRYAKRVLATRCSAMDRKVTAKPAGWSSADGRVLGVV